MLQSETALKRRRGGVWRMIMNTRIACRPQERGRPGEEHPLGGKGEEERDEELGWGVRSGATTGKAV